MQITHNKLRKLSRKFNKSAKNRLAKNSVSNTKLQTLLINRNRQQKINNIFSKVVNIDSEIAIANQDNSGRCWIFAFLNMIRYKMEAKYKLKNFEFSYAYVHFYDKLEKCNYFLNTIYETRNEKLDSRLIKHFLSNVINDGGNWNMFVNIINKYGIVPKSNFNESYQTNNTDTINTFLNNKLREYASELRRKGNKKYIDKCMEEIYNMLVICIGEPPNKIKWKYYREDKKKRYHMVDCITPLNFYKKYVPFNVDDMMVLIDNPCKPYNNKITIKYFNNMVNGREIEYLNVPINMMKLCFKRSIDNNEVVAFGCDVDKYIDTKIGVLDTDTIDYKSIFNTDIMINKRTRLDYLVSDVTHAMVFRGYDDEKKKTKKNKVSIVKYMVENSWGKSSGIDGYLVMSDKYFDEYVYQLVVNKKYIPPKVRDIIKKKPIILNPWDPFGNLLLN
jgi:bleomycin hydrolase